MQRPEIFVAPLGKYHWLGHWSKNRSWIRGADIAILEPYPEIDFTRHASHIDAAIALVGDCNRTWLEDQIVVESVNATPFDV